MGATGRWDRPQGGERWHWVYNGGARTACGLRVTEVLFELTPSARDRFCGTCCRVAGAAGVAAVPREPAPADPPAGQGLAGWKETVAW